MHAEGTTKVKIVSCCALQNENEDAAVDGGRTVADSSFGRVRRLWQGDR